MVMVHQPSSLRSAAGLIVVFSLVVGIDGLTDLTVTSSSRVVVTPFGRLFYLLSDSTTHNDSRCYDLAYDGARGFPATVWSANDQLAITELASKYLDSESYAILGAFASSPSIMLFTWSASGHVLGGTRTPYTNWETGYPRNFTTGPSCVLFNQLGKWYNAPCTAASYSVCTFNTSSPGDSPFEYSGSGTTYVAFNVKMDQLSAMNACNDLYSYSTSSVGALQRGRLPWPVSSMTNSYIWTAGRLMDYTNQGAWLGLQKWESSGSGKVAGWYRMNYPGEWFYSGLPYDNFASSSSGGGRTCAEMDLNNGRWNAIECTKKNYVICEYYTCPSVTCNTTLTTRITTTRMTTTYYNPYNTVSTTYGPALAPLPAENVAIMISVGVVASVLAVTTVVALVVFYRGERVFGGGGASPSADQPSPLQAAVEMQPQHIVVQPAPQYAAA